MALSATKDISSESVDKKPSESGWYEAAEVWTVKGATSSDTRYTVVNCADLPSIGSEDAEGVFVESRSARETEDPTTWKVDVRYASVPQGGLTPGYWTIEIPSERPAVYRWYTVQYEKTIVIGINQDTGRTEAITNSAGDPFDPPPIRTLSRIGLTIQRYEDDFDPLTIVYFGNRVSSDSFLGFPPGAARCMEINAEPHYENGESSYSVTYRFEFDEDLWIATLLDAGGRYLDDNGVLKVVDDDEGTTHGGLVLLDGEGKKLGPGASARYRKYETEYTVAFGPLGFT